MNGQRSGFVLNSPLRMLRGIFHPSVRARTGSGSSLPVLRMISPALYLAFFWMSAGTVAQPVHPDSDLTGYDSIQDLRMTRIRQGILLRLDQVDGDQAGLRSAFDSLLETQDSLQERLLRLENRHRELSEQWISLQERADQIAGDAEKYRQRLQRYLWLSGSLKLLLVAGLSLFLFLHSVRIRNFLQRQIASVREETDRLALRMKKKQKKLGRKLTRDMQSRGDRIEKKIRKEVRRRRKK